MGFNLGFSFAFSALFERIGWMPHGGLALANSLATALESVALVILMSRRLKGLEGGYVWKGIGISVIGTVLMAAVVVGWSLLFATSSRLVLVFGALGLGVAVYGGLMWALKMPELMGMVRALVGKLKRK
jgi:putative peptidoglycan lipid II flippase